MAAPDDANDEASPPEAPVLIASEPEGMQPVAADDANGETPPPEASVEVASESERTEPQISASANDVAEDETSPPEASVAVAGESESAEPQLSAAADDVAEDVSPPQPAESSSPPQASAVAVATPAGASVGGDALQKELRKDIAATAPPPLPRRRPRPPVTVAAAEDAAPRRMPADAREHPQPMSLGPAEPSAQQSPLSRGKVAPQSLGGYQLAVWSALARHKPRASERGSATVNFGINGSGGLAFVSVSRSSGNARLDRLALATVRGAAPFPSPPASLQARPYVVRIDFP